MKWSILMSKNETITLKVDVTITSKNEIIVGNGLFAQYKLFIEKDGNEYRITDEIKHISDWYETKEEAIKWVIKKLGERIK
jgi:hypothetical protein